MLAVIVHDVVGRNKCRHITTCLAGQIGVDSPVVAHPVGAVNSLVHRRRATVIGGYHQAPVLVYLVQVAQVARCGPRTFVGVLSLVDKAVHLEVVALARSQHELPQAHCTGRTLGAGLECRLNDGQILQFERQAIVVERLLKYGYVKVSGAQSVRHGAAQASAVLVDKLLHHLVVRHLHHHRQAAQTLLILLGGEGRVVVGVDTRGVGVEILFGHPLSQQRVAVGRHALGQVYHLVASVLVVVYGNFVLRCGRHKAGRQCYNQCL
ncbi:unknown [Prevotella sp. CAG:5226]|nr:unknown [Prevotella sp. CAG:5226]